MKTAEEFLDGTEATSAEEFLSAEGEAPKAEEFLRGTEPKPKLGDWLRSPPIPVGSAADAVTGLPAEYFHLRPDAKLPTAAESIRQETYQELSAGNRLLLDLLGPVQGAMSAIGGLITGAGQTMAMGPVVDAEQPAVTQRQAAEQIRALKAREDLTPSELADLLENNPVTRQGRAVQAWTEKEFPNVIPPEEFRPAHTIGQGLGNFAPMVGLGLVGGTPAALGAGGLMEFSDAYDRELDRQRRDREAIDPVKAFNKAAVYSGIATGIEGGLGVGYVLRRIKAMFGDAGVEAFQRGGFRGLLGAVGKEMGKAGGAGATEEGLQRLVQDVLVEENKPLLERPDWGAIGEEALAGGGAQALTLGLAGGVAGWRGRKAAEAGGPAPRRRTEQVSEFGGLAEQENLPGTGGVEAAPAAETPTPPATAAAGPSAETPSPAQAAADNTGAVPTNESEVMPDAVQGQERTEGTEVETTPPVTSAGGAPAILLDQLRGAIRRREAFPAQWLDQVNEGRDVPFALPEGYRRQGEQYVYEPPPKVETPAERMAREQREAMEDLRRRKQAKGAETAGGPAPATETQPVPEQSRAASRAPAETGVPLEVVGERAPDILDAIDGAVTRGKVRFPPEFKDYIARARGKAREMMSVTKGEAADTVLDGLKREGLYRRLDSLDDLAEAMLRAGESRIGERKARAAAKRKLAKLEKEELARSKARQTAAAEPEIEVDENNDFLAPLIKQLGGPDPDDLRFAPAELREGGRQGKVGSDETRAIQGRQQPGTTAGRELAGEGVGTEQGQPVSGPAGTVRPASAEARARLAQEVEGKLDRLYSRALGRKKEDAARGMASAWRDFHEALKGGEPLADVLARVNRAMQVALNTSRQPAVVTLPKGVDRATGRIEQEKVRLYGREPLDFARGRYLGLRFYRDAILAQARERFAPGDTTQPAPQGQAEVRRAEAAINEFLGTEKLPERVRVVYEPGAPYAGYYQGGRVVVNAARTSDPVRVLLEEGLHGVVAAIRDGELNDPGLLAALNEFADKVTAADVAREQARRQGLDTRAEVLAEEATIAKVLDENPGLIERLVRAIREAFRRWFGLELPAGGRERILRAAREYLRSQNQSLPGKRVVARNAIITFPGMGAYRYAVTAYHGTRHKVDRFTTQKIGTGEGQHVYGWGLYFAEEREVAERYRKALAEASLVDASGNTVELKTDEERDAAKRIHNQRQTTFILGEQIDGVQITLAARDEAKQYLHRAIENADEESIQYLTKVIGILEQWASRGVVPVPKGNIYTVSLNIEPDKLLHWETPLKEQSAYVQDAVRRIVAKLPSDEWRVFQAFKSLERWKGRELYNAWALGVGPEIGWKEAALLLRQEGIQGVRYLDYESRTKGEGTYNYVIFDESRIQILAENGQPVSAAEASGAPADIRFAPAEEVPEGMGRRATGEKILGSTAVSNQTKQAITEYLYQKRTLAVDDNFAAGLIQRVGLDQAEAVVRSRPEDVPGAVWSRLLRGVTRELARREREAPLEQKAEWAQRQAQLWNTVLPQITDVAQTLRALEDAVEMSPDAQVERARMEIERANGERLERRRPETDQMQQALDEGRQTGLEAVRQDPEVNARARAAVDAAVAASDETHRAIIMELAEPWAQSSAVLAHARAAVRAKAEELLNRGPRPPGMTPAQHLRQILDDLAKRAAGIAAWHYQGAEPGTTLAAKLEARLGLTKEHAERLAKQLDAEFARQFEAAKRKLSKRIAEARARLALRQADKERALGTQTGLDKAIMRQLRALNTRLGEVLRAEAGRRDETGRHVAERVVAESGLTGAKADALRAALTRRWNELVSEAQRRALAAIEKRSGVRVGRTLRNAFDKLVELDRLGALSSEKFFEVVKKALKLQRLTEADARKLRRLVELAQSKPEGWQRQRAMTDVLTFVEELKGDLSWWQAAMSIWYANIFSSPTTHAKNIIGNGLKLMETMAVELLHRPLAARQLLWALAEGTRKGVLEAASIMRTGKVEGTRLLKLEPARPLEAKRLPGNLDYLLTFFRVVGRAMATEDMVPFKANEEIRWAMVARRIARREGLPMWGRKLNQRVQELMHNTKADWESAKVQAAKEGLTGLDLLRRANEIIEQRREASMPGSLAVARQFALKQTYNADPYGLMGAIAGVLNNMNRSLQFTRFFVPVVRIVANLANESLNYFPPVGLSRVALTRWGPNEVRVFGKSWYFRNRIDGKPITDPDAMFHQTAVAAAGTVLFTALAWAVGRSVEDEDPPIALYGQGPRSRSQREQLRKTGWIPDSIKIGGRYYSYKESQLSIPLAILGNWFDAIRWKHLNEEDALNRMAYAAQTFSNTFLDRGMLSGVTSLLDALNPTGGQAGTQLTKALAKPASSIVVPNALRFIDNVFDPQMYEVDDVQGALLAQVPWARRAGRPALNAFGEPVERRPLDQFIVPQKPDPLVVLLASKSAWVPMPILDKQTVGKAEWGKDWLRPMTPDEYYQWIATSGPEIRRRLTDEMDRIRDMEDDEARAFVSKIAEQERAKAKREFVY